MARESGFTIEEVSPTYTEEQVSDLMKFDQVEKWGDPFPDEWLVEHVLSEKRAYAARGVSLVVTGFNVPCVLSGRKAHIPLVYLIPGTALPALLKEFVPAEIVNKMVDLAILHGGQGTFYTAAYSGRPVVGIPMQPEQQYNIDIQVRHGSAVRLSKRHFRGEALVEAIETILGDYEGYRTGAEALAQRLPVIDGAQRGAERIKAIAIECLD
jgi:UDP:flavonoid glycosyltransferase YjiC (YdhE family)